MTRAILLVTMLLFTVSTEAFFTEVSISGNYNKSMLDEHNYKETKSYSGSCSFYFWEQVAIELSYTYAYYYQLLTQEGTLPTQVWIDIELAGADLVLAFADKKASFQPYVKGGVTYIIKKQQLIDNGLGTKHLTELPQGSAPSAGIGLKLLVSERFSLKMGVDWWNTITSDTSAPLNDYAARFGISWIF